MADRPDPLRGYIDLLVDTLDEGLRGEEVARRAYLSRFHFDRLVRGATREPPGAMRRRLLLERAAHRLTRTTATVTEVGIEAGFATPSAFARAFGRAFGMSPTAYRRGAGAGFWLATERRALPPTGRADPAERSRKGEGNGPHGSTGRTRPVAHRAVAGVSFSPG